MSTTRRVPDLLRNLQTARFAEAEALENLIAAITDTAGTNAPTAADNSLAEIEPCYLSVRQLAAHGSVAEAADLHPSTWLHDESVIRCHFKPEFGSLRLEQLTASACKDFRKSLQDKKLSGKTATNVLDTMPDLWRESARGTANAFVGKARVAESPRPSVTSAH